MLKKIGLTGSSGLIATELLKRCKKKYTFKKFVGDMTNLADVENFMKNDFDVVIHLASIIPKYDQNGMPLNQSFLGNVTGTENICKMASKYEKKVIFTSTQRVYKIQNNVPLNEISDLAPNTDYGKSKLDSEKILQKYLTPKNYTILRISNIYGTYPIRPSIIDSIAESFLKDEPIKVGLATKTSRDYIHIFDVIDSLELSIYKSGIFNICYGKSYEINTIIEIFENIFGKKSKITFGDYNPENIILDNGKAKNELNFKPKVDLHKGINLTINLIRNLTI